MTPRLAALCLALATLAGCASVVSKPVQPRLFDLGPPPPAASAPVPASASTAPLVLPAVDAVGALEGSGLLYRLAYADPNQLRPYSESRWSAPVTDLVRERLATLLSRERTIVSPGQLTAGTGGAPPQVLRIELQEFVQDFLSPDRSEGRLRLQATLLQAGAEGNRVLAQRAFSVRRPAPTADAAGGVQALSQAVDAAAAEIAQWLRNTGAATGRRGLHSS